MLAFLLSHVTYDMQYLLCTGKLSDAFINVNQLPTFCPLCFQCHEIPFLRVPSVWSILLTSLPRGHLLHHTVLPYTAEFIFTKFLWLYDPTSPFLLELCGGSSWISLLALSVITSSLHFYPCWPVPFQWSIFVNCHMGVSLETERKHSYMLCSLCTN